MRPRFPRGRPSVSRAALAAVLALLLAIPPLPAAHPHPGAFAAAQADICGARRADPASPPLDDHAGWPCCLGDPVPWLLPTLPHIAAAPIRYAAVVPQPHAMPAPGRPAPAYASRAPPSAG
jgi:hypothetical protein